MKIHAADVTEQGISFVLVEVKLGVLGSPTQCDAMIELVKRKTGDAEVVLVGRDLDRRPKFYGREDIVRFLSKVQIDRYAWKVYEV